MSVGHVPRVLDEIATLLASNPSRDQLLEFQPSDDVRQRAQELLQTGNSSSLSPDEQRELDQFEQAEILMRLVKARLHSRS